MRKKLKKVYFPQNSELTRTNPYIKYPDNIHEAVNVLGRLGVGFIVILWCKIIYNIGNVKNQHLKEKVARAFLISAFPLGVVSFVLFFAPDMEKTFIKSVAGVLLEADTALTRNNVLAQDKIGTVFMNTNVAAVFWGMTMWLAMWMRQRSIGIRRVVYTVFAVVFCIGVLAAGSRGALLALISTIVLAIVIRSFYSKENSRFDREALRDALIIVATVLCVIFLEYSGLKQSIFLSALSRTQEQAAEGFGNIGGDRFLLWAHALTAIRQEPLVGYGVIDFAAFGSPLGFPPHNILLLIWIYGGLPAVVGLVWLFAAVFRRLFRQLPHSHGMWLPIVLLSWVIIQAMFTNLLFGNYRVSMLLWLIVSLFLYVIPGNIVTKRGSLQD